MRVRLFRRVRPDEVEAYLASGWQLAPRGTRYADGALSLSVFREVEQDEQEDYYCDLGGEG